MRCLMMLGTAFLLAGCNTWSNKPTVPETSRTAVVHDVRVGLTAVDPVGLTANVGDEVRFINDKTQLTQGARFSAAFSTSHLEMRIHLRQYEC